MKKKNQFEEELKNLNKSHESANSNTSSSGEPSWFTAAKLNVANTQKINQIKQELAKITLKEDKIRKLHERAKVIKKKLTNDRNKSETKVDFSKKGMHFPKGCFLKCMFFNVFFKMHLQQNIFENNIFNKKSAF